MYFEGFLTELELNKKLGDFLPFKDENMNNISKWAKSLIYKFISDFKDNGIIDTNKQYFRYFLSMVILFGVRKMSEGGGCSA
jgi:hypothetical protein